MVQEEDNPKNIPREIPFLIDIREDLPFLSMDVFRVKADDETAENLGRLLKSEKLTSNDSNDFFWYIGVVYEIILALLSFVFFVGFLTGMPLTGIELYIFSFSIGILLLVVSRRFKTDKKVRKGKMVGVSYQLEKINLLEKYNLINQYIYRNSNTYFWNKFDPDWKLTAFFRKVSIIDIFGSIIFGSILILSVNLFGIELYGDMVSFILFMLNLLIMTSLILLGKFSKVIISRSKLIILYVIYTVVGSIITSIFFPLEGGFLVNLFDSIGVILFQMLLLLVIVGYPLNYILGVYFDISNYIKTKKKIIDKIDKRLSVLDMNANTEKTRSEIQDDYYEKESLNSSKENILSSPIIPNENLGLMVLTITAIVTVANLTKTIFPLLSEVTDKIPF